MSDEQDKTKEMHDYEQACAMLAETQPPMWWRLYGNLQKEGFTKEEAMKLLCAWIQNLKSYTT